MKHTIFVSYSRKDKELMQRLVADLKKSGLEVWTDNNVRSGDRWSHTLGTKIEQSSAVVVLMSKNAKSSDWVEKEINYSQIHNIPIFPVLASDDEKTAIPVALANKQFIDIRAEYPNEIKKLIDDIWKCCKEKKESRSYNFSSTNLIFPKLSVRVPLLGTVSAGAAVEVYSSHDVIEVPFSTLAHTDPTKVFALQVKGNSMIGASIADRDIVLLREQNTADTRNGDMVVVLLDPRNESTLKYFYRHGRIIRLQPANRNISVIITDISNCHVQGKVIGIIRQFK